MRLARMTIWRWMVVVAVVAVDCTALAYLRRWEGRRTVMYQQRDMTRSIMLAAKQDIPAAGRAASEVRNESDRVTYTTHWTERLEAWESHHRQTRPLIRATVSGASGWFSRPPIIVETYGSPLDGPWLDRLLRVYSERGWEYKIIRIPGD